MTNAELIAEYLEAGGEVTKCKNFTPQSDQYRIRSKPSQHFGNRPFVQDKAVVDLSRTPSKQKETERVYGVEI